VLPDGRPQGNADQPAGNEASNLTEHSHRWLPEPFEDEGKELRLHRSAARGTHEPKPAKEEVDNMITTGNPSNSESFTFQTETQQLLHLMIHSLYTNKDVFLRELIANASDALDRVRFDALISPELIAGNRDLEIEIEADPKERTLTIRDNGIGMNRKEVIENLGTIAKSGTRELMRHLHEGARSLDLIGQFGVGFYSSFMVADKVEVVTRRAGEEGATRWESSGDGSYTVADSERPSRGTTIVLHLKPADHEESLDDYTDEWTVKRIVKRYSDFVIHPIRLKVQREEPVKQANDNEHDGPEAMLEQPKARLVTRWETVNSMKPIWTRPESELTEEDLKEFYKRISRDWNDPMLHIALKVEGLLEYRALLFVSASAPDDLYFVGYKPGLQLYARRVMIMERCEGLLPRYLRFLKGVVEASDLPLNVSRELLQANRQITGIRKGVVRKVLETLKGLKTDDYALYERFWREFGRALKEGVGEENDYRDRLISLLLFESSAEESALTDLDGYVSRMKEGQNEIFYLTGESRAVIQGSPHLEAFRARGIEVLYLTDPVDELLVQTLREYQDKKLKSAGKGEVEFASDGPETMEERRAELKQREKDAAPLLEKLHKHLQQHVKQVRLSGRLTQSPACLVGAEHDDSPRLEKLLLRGAGGRPKQRRILELNPTHPIVVGLLRRHQAAAEDPALGEYAELLFGYAALAEGSELPDPHYFNGRLVNLMSRSV
jgi:molecular chaperone HtpG